MASGERDVRLDRLRGVSPGERGLLSNARCLAEGVDVPTLDGVAFVDPRRSEVDVVQAVGRAIRKAEDKAIGTVVLPVFVGSGEDAEAKIESSAFDHVWQVLNALRSHDEALGEELDALRRELGRRGSLGKRPGKISLLLPVGVDPSFARAFDARLVEATTAGWEFWYGLLLDYVSRTGSARGCSSSTERGFNLGRWVIKQRVAFDNDHLIPDRAERLAALRGWSWDPYSDTWEEAFTVLERFVAREGDALVPQKHVEDGFLLGIWVSTQRATFSRGNMPVERAEKLQRLEGWSWDPPADKRERGLSLLQEYVAREGHSRVPVGHVEDGFPLGKWVQGQRIQYAGGRLIPEQVQRLSQVPRWVWRPVDDQWEQNFAKLQAFVAREGHARVPYLYAEGGLRLGNWVQAQRAAYKAGRLDEDKIKRLARLARWTWDANEAAWEEGLVALQRFIEREGNARVPRDYRDEAGYRLGQWVTVQRAAFRRGKLGDERSSRLAALPAGNGVRTMTLGNRASTRSRDSLSEKITLACRKATRTRMAFSSGCGSTTNDADVVASATSGSFAWRPCPVGCGSHDQDNEEGRDHDRRPYRSR